MEVSKITQPRAAARLNPTLCMGCRELLNSIATTMATAERLRLFAANGNGGAPVGAPPLFYRTCGSGPSPSALAGTLQIVVSLVIDGAGELQFLVLRVRVAARDAETAETLAEVG